MRSSKLLFATSALALGAWALGLAPQLGGGSGWTAWTPAGRAPGAGQATPAMAPPPPPETGAIDTDVLPAGSLIITEIMVRPNSDLYDGSTVTYDEWIELYNNSGAELDLLGCKLDSSADGDGTDYDSIDESVLVPAGSFVVLAKEVTSNAPRDCIDDPSDGCDAPVAWRFSNTVGFSNADVDRAAIYCEGNLIDEVSFDWTEVSDNDRDCAAPGGCTLALDPASLSDADNDDATTLDGPWGLTDASAAFTNSRLESTYGTPGAANVLAPEDTGTPPDDSGPIDTGRPPVDPDVCGAGQAIFTELMPSPKGDSSHEWIELKGTGASCSLNNCMIVQSTSSDPDDTSAWDASDKWLWLSEETEDQLQLADGLYKLLAKVPSDDISAGVTWTNTDGATATADYLYGYTKIYLSSEPRWLYLMCEDTLVDAAPMDWASHENEIANCPTEAEDVAEGQEPGGCSLNLNSGAEDASSNDSDEAWCVPPGDGNTWTRLDLDEGDTGVEAHTTVIHGTPGRAGDCVSYDWPEPGDVVFTEVMPSPSGTNEWFEVHAFTGGASDLTLCTLKRYRLDEEGTEDPDSVKTYQVGTLGESISLAEGDIHLFADDGCILESDTADTASACIFGDASEYSSLTFTDGESEHLALICPMLGGGEQTIDEFQFNTELQGVRKGHALMFNPTGSDPASDNDATTLWCEAGFDQEFCEAGDGLCNYGTPGALGECVTTITGPTDTWCRCGTGPAPATALSALAGLLLLVRRRRDG